MKINLSYSMLFSVLVLISQPGISSTNNGRTLATDSFQDQGSSRQVIITTRVSSKPNLCIQKFSAYSDELGAFQKKYHICRSHNFSKRSINAVRWSNVFSCFDKYKSLKSIKDRDLYLKNCLKPDHNNYLQSKDVDSCDVKMNKLAGFSLHKICAYRNSGLTALTSKFDNCTQKLVNTDIIPQRRAEICAKRDGQDQVTCYGKLKNYLPSKLAWSKCSHDANLRHTVVHNGKNLSSCMDKLTQIGLESDKSLLICTDFNAKEEMKCIVNTADQFGLDTVYNKCQEYYFREANQNRNFSHCLTKVKKDGFDQKEALNICSTSNERLNNIVNSSHFNKCLDHADTFNIDLKHMYDVCADSVISKRMKNQFYFSCIEKGVSAGSMNYFDLKNEETTTFYRNDSTRYQRFDDEDQLNENNPYAYVFKDCNGDYKYKNEKKRYNRYLKVYQDFNIHSSEKFTKDNLLIGGLSALRFNTDEQKLYLLSDDRGFNAGASPRIYVYNYNFNNKNKMSLTEDRILPLIKEVTYKAPAKKGKKEEGKGKKSKMITKAIDMDPEGFDFTTDGKIIISSEVDNLMGNDFISIFSATGQALDTIKISDDFRPVTKSKRRCSEYTQRDSYTSDFYSYDHRSDGRYQQYPDQSQPRVVTRCNTTYTKMGVVPNKSFESLSLSPDKRFLFTANEDALYQDQSRRHSTRGERVRIVKFENIDGKYSETKQFFYRLDKEPENGLVDLLSIDENNLLVLERSWDNIKKKITAKIYHVTLNQAENILDVTAKEIPQVRSVKKELILNLDDVKYEISPGFRKFDNLEGMTFGPKLPNGKQSLVLVSDNNFRQSQRTTLIIFEINTHALNQLNR